ncbi:MAG: ethylbenzene dehydrogenase-related protein [Pyrinomonadaceae bacterium]
MKNAIIIIVVLCSFLFVESCRRSVVLTPDLQVVSAAKIPVETNDSAWRNAPTHGSKLILQDLVEPRLMETSTQDVQVQAITDGKEVAFRLEWHDDTKNDAAKPHNFVDGCAVQIPVKIEESVPAPQMGETNKIVQISYWRADWQAIVDGRADDITAMYPNSKPDHYPFNAKSLEKNTQAQKEMAERYAPARALGNNRQGPRKQPVEDLLAEGPGTISPNPKPFSKGKGGRTDKGWEVIITRPLPEGFSKNKPTQIAFAVWEGSHGETGARKMRTGWVNLIMK